MLEDFVRCAECAVEELAWIRISLVRGLTFAHVAALLRAFDLPEDIFAMPVHAVAKVIGSDLAVELMSVENETRAREILQWLRDTPEASLMTFADPDYPENLKRCGTPPVVLYLRGKRELLGKPLVAVIGSDYADTQGLEDARNFTRALVGRGFGVVTDLWNDLACEVTKTALLTKGGGGLVAVSAIGSDNVYPVQAREGGVRALQEGVIVSLLPPGEIRTKEGGTAQQFVMLALVSKILVVQAEQGSRTETSARMAGEMGADIFAIPGSIHSTLYKGCHRLIRDGAVLTESLREITQE